MGSLGLNIPSPIFLKQLKFFKDMKQKLLSILMLCTLLVGVAFAQHKTSTGRVTSSDNCQTLPGVSVVVPGTTVGTQTDVNGAFTLQIPADAATLEYSYIGFLPQTVTIGTNTTFDISLVADATQL